MLVYGKYECYVMRCCMFVSCVHTVAVLNTAFCMTFVNVGMQEATIWKRHTPEQVS